MDGLDAAPQGADDTPRWRRVLIRLRKPLLVLAGVGTVLGGLAGYLNAYRAVTSGPAAPSATAADQLPAGTLSIMLLPLANLSGDAGKDFIAEGLTAALTADLSRIQDAVIVPPQPALAIQARNLDLRTLYATTRVRFVLQGGVQVSGDAIRLTMQLIDAERQTPMWSERFDGSLQQLFKLQDEFTGRVRSAVGPATLLALQSEAEKRNSEPSVSEMLLRAAALGQHLDRLDDLEQAAGLARKALQAEPENMRAAATLARALFLQVYNFSAAETGWSTQDIDARLAEAATLARRVVDQGVRDPRMFNVLSGHALRSGQPSAARDWAERALRLDPNGAQTLLSVGDTLAALGDAETARQYTLRALSLQPPFPAPVAEYFNLSHYARVLDRPDEALDWARKLQAAAPQSPWSYLSLALSHGWAGQAAEAQAAGRELRRLLPRVRIATDVHDAAWERPWPGREAAFQAHIERRIAAARLAGIPE